MKNPLGRLAIIGVAFLSVLAVGAPAQASTVASRPNRPMLAIPLGAKHLLPGTTTNIGTTVIDGKVVPVSIETSQISVSRVTTYSTRCVTYYQTIYYGPSWYRQMRLRQFVSWCYNGNTISSHGQSFYAYVYGAGLVGQWRWMGMATPPSERMYYNNWAWQMSGQGMFAQCPAYLFNCLDFKYPILSMNIYADGRLDTWGSA